MAKILMQLLGCAFVSLVGILCLLEITKVSLRAAVTNLGGEGVSVFCPKNTLKSRSVIFVEASVAGILLKRCLPQIFDSVIQPITVPVVDYYSRPFTIKEQPARDGCLNAQPIVEKRQMHCGSNVIQWHLFSGESAFPVSVSTYSSEVVGRSVALPSYAPKPRIV